MERQVDVQATVTQTGQVNPVNNMYNPFAIPPPFFPPFVTAPIDIGCRRDRGPEEIRNNANIAPVTIPAGSTLTLTYTNETGCTRCDDRRDCGGCRSNRGCGGCGSCGGCNSCGDRRGCCPRFSRCPRPDRASITLNLNLQGTNAAGQSTVIVTAGDRMVQTVTIVGTSATAINTTIEVFSFELPFITVQNTGNMDIRVLGGSVQLRGVHHREDRINRFDNFNNGFGPWNNGFGGPWGGIGPWGFNNPYI